MMTSNRRGQNRWIDTEGGFIGAAWFWPSQAAAVATAVLIVPGIAHEERTMAGGLVALAESLADAGLPTLLMDLHGCSQSAGRIDDADIGACWRTGIRAAVRHARSTGAARVIVVGVRLGAPLAAEALADEPLAAFVAWAPIVSGRRYVRELKVLQRTNDAEVAGGLAIGGFSIPAPVLEYIAALDLTKNETLSASCVLLRETPEGLNVPWLARLGERGVMVQEQISTQIRPWLFGTTDQPALPHEDIAGIARWCRALHDGQAVAAEPSPRRPAARSSIEFVHEGNLVRETFVEIGPNGLTGVWSGPAVGINGHAARLLMSTVGPGRTFADFARDEASRGNSSLRFDFAGFGTSGRSGPVQGGELYTDEGGRDVQAAIEHLRQAGHQKIYGLGFCAGAWSMIQATVAPALDAVVAINVAFYRQPGPAAPERVNHARRHLARVAPALRRYPLLRRFVALMRRKVSERCTPIEWLTRLCGGDTRVLLAYAEGDLGLDYLTRQMKKGLSGQLRRPFTMRTYASLGHLAEGPSARTRMFRDITDFFASLDREAQRQKTLRIPAVSPNPSRRSAASNGPPPTRQRSTGRRAGGA